MFFLNSKLRPLVVEDEEDWAEEDLEIFFLTDEDDLSQLVNISFPLKGQWAGDFSYMAEGGDGEGSVRRLSDRSFEACEDFPEHRVMDTVSTHSNFNDAFIEAKRLALLLYNELEEEKYSHLYEDNNSDDDLVRYFDEVVSIARIIEMQKIALSAPKLRLSPKMK